MHVTEKFEGIPVDAELSPVSEQDQEVYEEYCTDIANVGIFNYTMGSLQRVMSLLKQRIESDRVHHKAKSNVP